MLNGRELAAAGLDTFRGWVTYMNVGSELLHLLIFQDIPKNLDLIKNMKSSNVKSTDN